MWGESGGAARDGQSTLDGQTGGGQTGGGKGRAPPGGSGPAAESEMGMGEVTFEVGGRAVTGSAVEGGKSLMTCEDLLGAKSPLGGAQGPTSPSL